VIRFGQNQNLVFPKAFDLLRLCLAHLGIEPEVITSVADTELLYPGTNYKCLDNYLKCTIKLAIIIYASINYLSFHSINYSNNLLVFK